MTHQFHADDSRHSYLLDVPAFLIHLFSQDPKVIHYGVIYLKIVSLANVAVGTILTVSAVSQGIEKTYPTLVCAIADNFLFVIAVFTLPAFLIGEYHLSGGSNL